MDFIGQIFGLIGQSQNSIEQSRAAESADRYRAGQDTTGQTENKIFYALVLLLVVVLFIFRKKITN